MLAAASRLDALLAAIQPSPSSEFRRLTIAHYICGVIKRCFLPHQVDAGAQFAHWCQPLPVLPALVPPVYFGRRFSWLEAPEHLPCCWHACCRWRPSCLAQCRCGLCCQTATSTSLFSPRQRRAGLLTVAAALQALAQCTGGPQGSCATPGPLSCCEPLSGRRPARMRPSKSGMCRSSRRRCALRQAAPLGAASCCCCMFVCCEASCCTF